MIIQRVVTHCLKQGFYYCDERPWPKQPGEQRVLFDLPAQSHSPSRETEVGTESEAMRSTV